MAGLFLPVFVQIFHGRYKYITNYSYQGKGEKA